MGHSIVALRDSAFQHSDDTIMDLLRHGDSGITCAIECFHRHDLVVVRIAKAILRPVVKMVCGSDGSRRALILSNGEELSEGARSRDRWLVGTGIGAHLVRSPVRRESTKALGSGARVIIAVVLNYIVFRLRRVDPAIHG